LIILDEIETILNTFSSETIADREFEIKETFYELLSNGKKIIANDAFLSDRGVNFLRTLRTYRGDEQKIYLSINTQKPPPRDALVIKDKEKFENALLKDIEAGKKIIFHCSSKENVKRICNSIKSIERDDNDDNEDEVDNQDKENIDDEEDDKEDNENENVEKLLMRRREKRKMKQKYKVLVYHGEMDDKLKMETATNVNVEWKKYDLVAYSPSINTGLNFTDDKYFDKKYFMGSKNSAVVRDAVQAIDRARETKTQELVIHFLNDHNDKYKFFGSRDEAIKQRFKYESKELKRLRKLYKIGEKKKKAKLNDWFSDVKLYNEKERRQTDAAFSKVFMYYLKELNYEVKFDDVELSKEEKDELEKLECDTDLPYEEIEPVGIDDKKFKELNDKRKNNEATEYEKARVVKEYMLRRFYYGRNFTNHVDVGELEKIWKCWKKGSEQSKLKRSQDEMTDKLKQKFEEGLESDTTRLEKITCYPEITKMYKVLGIKHSADDEKHFKTEDFEAKKQELQPLITELFKKLNIRDKNKNRTFKQSDGTKLKNDINRILKQWTGSSFKKCESKRKRKEGKKIHDTEFNLQNMVGVDKDILKNENP
jgi:hypothetical protein